MTRNKLCLSLRHRSIGNESRAAQIVLSILAVTMPLALAAEPRVAPLVPGLDIARLPVELSNINSVVYGQDGRLYAAAYDGRVLVLTDSDGDGIEDQARAFWDKPGDLLTPVGMVAAAEGIYLAVRGKIVLIKDRDGDGVGDASETVVSGWVKETHNSDRRNDASGVALDSAGNLYFSLGCMSYNKAWMLDGKGRSRYSKADERGAILKVSPDRKHREILATGMRFVIGLDFNKHGDLFATDQEGDTWFPGGNPRDELLHVVPSRHYGFPFRHAKYLPDAIDEPEVVGFSPQHQSTCGFRFNETRPGRTAFGPAHWEGDALVTGFSRGKLWRVPLAKTRAGYVGRQVQIAAFESLLTDVAVSPNGDLLVTAHGGAPDWGSGPAAKGYLYKIRFDRASPQPVAAWSASPVETTIAFDRPIDPKKLQLPEIEMGEFVWEGHRSEWILPGYEVVKAEKRAPRRTLEARALRVSEDGRTVTITTAPQSWRARYGIVLPGVQAKGAAKETTPSTIELSHDLSGVSAEWTRDGDSAVSWKGYLPHVDLNVIRTLTRGSAAHEELFRLLREPGELTMRCQLLLPGKEVAFRFESNRAFRVRCGETEKSSREEAGQVAVFSIVGKGSRKNSEQEPPRGDREQVLPTEEMRLEIALRTGAPELSFDASYHADFDPHERPLRLEHLFLPWAPTLVPPPRDPSEGGARKAIAGDPEKGRQIFFGPEANCALCHSFAGKGGKVGADLTTSVHRGPDAVLQDIIDPNASINPEYLSYAVTTRDGTNLIGLFLSADDQEITLIDTTAQTHTIARADIAEINALPVSLMPPGFERLGKEKLQDLVAFLCTADPDVMSNLGAGAGILREYWLGIPDGDITALTKHKNFPDQPSGSGLLKQFEGPANWDDYYGTRISGYIHPPQTGDYTFHLAADDHAELWLSTGEKPDDRVRIIQLDRWTASRAWDRYPEQNSKPIRLEAGRRYYIEALHTEARVDDCLAVGWSLPDKAVERPIPGNRLSPPSARRP